MAWSVPSLAANPCCVLCAGQVDDHAAGTHLDVNHVSIYISFSKYMNFKWIDFTKYAIIPYQAYLFVILGPDLHSFVYLDISLVELKCKAPTLLEMLDSARFGDICGNTRRDLKSEAVKHFLSLRANHAFTAGNALVPRASR